MQADNIVVSGAGIVGMTMTLALLKKAYKPLLIAPKYAPKANLGETYHPRIYALSASSKAFLEALGVWSLLPMSRVTPVKAMQIQGDQSGQLHLDQEASSNKDLAWIVESGEIELALQKALSIYGVTWLDDKVIQLRPHALNTPSPHAEVHWEVQTEKGEKLMSDLLIVAEGAASNLRTALGIWHQRKSYESVGLVAQLTVEKPHENTAYQWFTPEGILAFLPLPDTQEGHQVSMVWSAPLPIAKAVQATPAEELPTLIKKRIGELSQDALGGVNLRSPLHGFDLSLDKSGLFTSGAVLIGDAAHRVHPLAGQGLNLGLADVQVLSDILSQKEKFRALGSYRLLQRYQRERSVALASMSSLTDGLHFLFQHQSFPVQMLRNFGMDMVDKLPSLKKFLIKKASGTSL